MKFKIIVIILLLAGIASADSYVYGPNGLLARINESGNITYYHSDHLGSHSAMSNEKGEVISESVYLPFGQSSGSEKYGFTGKEFEPDLNLNYFGARYYDPETGRFITFDPMGQQYIYANNNPLKYTDPDGRSPAAAGAIAAGGFFATPPGWVAAAIVAGGVTTYFICRFVIYRDKPPEESIERSNYRPKDEVLEPEAERLPPESIPNDPPPIPLAIIDPIVVLPALWLPEVIEPSGMEIPMGYWAVDIEQAVKQAVIEVREEKPKGMCRGYSKRLIDKLRAIGIKAWPKGLYGEGAEDPYHIYVGTEVGDVNIYPEAHKVYRDENGRIKAIDVDELIGVDLGGKQISEMYLWKVP